MRCPRHPPIAVAWTIGCPELEELPGNCISEVILAVEESLLCPMPRPGTADMGTKLAKYLPKNRLFILARHGR